jgi:YbgC/YbaW family acyl-CoA thioester hydrolase
VKQHVVERKITWGDLDSLGIVFYPRYYEWMDACGHLFFEAIGMNLGDLFHGRHIQFGLIETGFKYFKPGRYHQTIRIVTRLTELDKKTLGLKHGIHCATRNKIMAEGFEKRICMDVADPENIKAMDIPDDIFTVLKTALSLENLE